MKAQLKVSRAITKAAFEHPFFGSCAMSLKVQPSEQIGTMATDGTNILWNEKFVDTLSEPHTLSIICHEVMHVILQHCQPWEGKDHKLCNIAMDHVINQTLADEGFTFPEGVILDKDATFRGWTWQKVYSVLDDCMKKEENEDYGPTGAADNAGLSKEKQEELGKSTENMMSDPSIEDVLSNPDLSDAEREELKQKIEQMTIQAAENAKNQCGRIPGGIEGIIKEIRQSKVDWKARIREIMQSSHPDDYTMRRPNKKFLQGGIYMPSMEGTQVGNLVIGLDTSGSVSKDDMVRFLSEMNAISNEMHPTSVTVIYTDCDVAKVETYYDGEEISELNTRGGGGTSFVPVFDYIRDQGLEVDHLIYFSDMEVWEQCFPEEHPEFPVLWLSTRSDYAVPFGELILVQE